MTTEYKAGDVVVLSNDYVMPDGRRWFTAGNEYTVKADFSVPEITSDDGQLSVAVESMLIHDPTLVIYIIDKDIVVDEVNNDIRNYEAAMEMLK